MKRALLLCLTGLVLALQCLAQSTPKIKELEKKRGELQQQITRSESLLRSTRKDVGSQLQSLALLNNQIGERRKYIRAIEADVRTLDHELTRLQRQINRLGKELDERKKKYESSVQYLYKNRTIQEKLLFIFSARTLSQTYRRMRYMQEYASFQRLQGEEIKKKQEQVQRKRSELTATRKAKTALLKQGEAEKEKLEKQEKEQQGLVSNLRKKQKDIQNELARQRKQAGRLNAQIDRLVEIEIEKARKRAREEARRQANAAAKEAGKESGKAGSPAAPVENFSLSKADRQLSGSFEKNKGLLPVPITGPYAVVSRYGQYAVEGLKNVKLDNKGIDIQGKPGAKARAIFDGEVSAIFQYNGLTGVLIRHGNYISVYCNLSSVSVGKGSKVKTGDVIGSIYAANGHPVLHFQLRKETARLNPEPWLNR